MEVILVNQQAFQELSNEVSNIKKMLSEKASDQEKEKLFTIPEAKQILKIRSTKTLMKYKSRGDLACVHFGSKILFTKESIDQFIKKYSN